MTSFTTRMMVRAAMLVVAAGAASAQTMKAEIPFTFRAGDRVMAAGTYQVTELNRQSGPPVFRVADMGGRHAILLMPNALRDTEKGWEAAGKALLAFDCGGSRCALAAVWRGYPSPAYSFKRQKLGRDEPARFTMISMRPDKAE